MRHEPEVYLRQMLELSQEAQDMAATITWDEYLAERRNQLSLAHLLQNIGEAARLVEPSVRVQIKEIPWDQVTGMRHKIVHDYLAIDYLVVWNTVKHDLPKLIEVLLVALEG